METIPKTAAPISDKPDPPISSEEKSKIAESEEAQEPSDKECDDHDDIDGYDEDRDMDNDNDEVKKIFVTLPLSLDGVAFTDKEETSISKHHKPSQPISGTDK